MGPYDTEDRALQRVHVLQEAGIWPGVIRYADSTFGLTFDPGLIIRGYQ